MDKQERERKFKEQKTALYSAFGRFAVNFELVCFALRQGIFWMLNSGGLRKERLADILLTDLTAKPLQNIYRSMASEIQELSNNDRRVIKNIFKRIDDLIEKRNDIIHATWFIEWASPKDTDFSEARGIKPDRDKKGGKIKLFRFKIKDFNELSKEAFVLLQLISNLSVCLTSNFKIEKNFEFNENKDVILPIRKEKKEGG